MSERFIYITWPDQRKVSESEMRQWFKDAMDEQAVDPRADWETCPVQDLAAALNHEGLITWWNPGGGGD